MPEMWVRSLDQEDTLEKEMATHSSIFAWEIPWTEEPGGLQSMGSQRVGHNLATKQQQQQQSMQGRLVWTWNSIQFLFQKQQKVSKYSLSEKWKDEIYIV